MSNYDLIWKTICRVPHGSVATYGQIARVAGLDGHARLVGYALHALPRGSNVPWHRIISSTGKISLPGVSGRRQRHLLESEGIQFQPSGKINLKLFQWKR
jgi:methylated-DNA-protein-cysteine methyltransferase-like protein